MSHTNRQHLQRALACVDGLLSAGAALVERRRAPDLLPAIRQRATGELGSAAAQVSRAMWELPGWTQLSVREMKRRAATLWARQRPAMLLRHNCPACVTDAARGRLLEAGELAALDLGAHELRDAIDTALTHLDNVIAILAESGSGHTSHALRPGSQREPGGQLRLDTLWADGSSAVRGA